MSSPLPYLLGGAAVIALGGAAAWWLSRPPAAEGVPAGAKGGYFWQSPDGSQVTPTGAPPAIAAPAALMPPAVSPQPAPSINRATGNRWSGTGRDYMGNHR